MYGPTAAKWDAIVELENTVTNGSSTQQIMRLLSTTKSTGTEKKQSPTIPSNEEQQKINEQASVPTFQSEAMQIDPLLNTSTYKI